MSNPFLQAKRTKTIREIKPLHSRKYPEIWKLTVDELKLEYQLTGDPHLKGAITRAINERLGLKVIRPTEKQLLARELNFVRFISTGAIKNLEPAYYRLKNAPDKAVILSVMSNMHDAINGLYRLVNALEEMPKQKDQPRQRTNRTRKPEWKEL